MFNTRLPTKKSSSGSLLVRYVSNLQQRSRSTHQQYSHSQYQNQYQCVQQQQIYPIHSPPNIASSSEVQILRDFSKNYILEVTKTSRINTTRSSSSQSKNNYINNNSHQQYQRSPLFALDSERRATTTIQKRQYSETRNHNQEIEAISATLCPKNYNFTTPHIKSLRGSPHKLRKASTDNNTPSSDFVSSVIPMSTQLTLPIQIREPCGRKDLTQTLQNREQLLAVTLSDVKSYTLRGVTVTTNNKYTQNQNRGKSFSVNDQRNQEQSDRELTNTSVPSSCVDVVDTNLNNKPRRKVFVGKQRDKSNCRSKNDDLHGLLDFLDRESESKEEEEILKSSNTKRERDSERQRKTLEPSEMIQIYRRSSDEQLQEYLQQSTINQSGIVTSTTVCTVESVGLFNKSNNSTQQIQNRSDIQNMRNAKHECIPMVEATDGVQCKVESRSRAYWKRAVKSKRMEQMIQQIKRINQEGNIDRRDYLGYLNQNAKNQEELLTNQLNVNHGQKRCIHSKTKLIDREGTHAVVGVSPAVGKGVFIG